MYYDLAVQDQVYSDAPSFWCSTSAYVLVRITPGALIADRTLMRFLAAEPCSTAGLIFPCQYLCG